MNRKFQFKSTQENHILTLSRTDIQNLEWIETLVDILRRGPKSEKNENKDSGMGM